MKSFVDDQGRWRHRFRQSFLNTAAICPERARLEAVGDMPDIQTDAAACGTAIHAAIEVCIDAGGLSLGDMHDIALTDFKGMVAQDNFEWKKRTPDQAHGFIVACINRWHAEVLPTLNLDIIQTEVEFTLPFYEDDQRVIELRGTADAVLPDHVKDWKSASRPYQPWEYRRHAVQASVYTWAFQVPRFEYVILAGDKEVQRFFVERGSRDWAWLEKQCVDWAKLIELDLPSWPTNDTSALCSPQWCSAWSQCRGLYLGLTKPSNW